MGRRKGSWYGVRRVREGREEQTYGNVGVGMFLYILRLLPKRISAFDARFARGRTDVSGTTTSTAEIFLEIGKGEGQKENP